MTTTVNPVLKQFLNMMCTPERADMLSDIADYLTELGDDTHEFAVNNILARFDNEDPSVSVADVEGSLRTIVADLLQSHGVLLNDLDLPYIAGLLKTIMGIPMYGDPVSLLKIVESDSPPECMLAEMTEYFTEYDWTSVCMVIGEVKYTLIEEIREVLKKNIDSMTVNDAMSLDQAEAQFHALEEIRNRTRVVIGERTDTILQNMLKEGIPLGLEIDHYIDECRSQLETLEPEDLANELIVLVYGSNTDGGLIQETIKEQLDAIVGNSGLMTKATIAVESALGVSYA
jgi:hypothetical protein